MALRSASDFKAALDYATAAVEVDEFDQLSPVLLGGLATAVGADAVALTHLDLRTHREVAMFWPHARPDPAVLEQYPSLGHTHPLRRPLAKLCQQSGLSRAGAGQYPAPVRISDVLGHRAWRATPIYLQALRGTTDQMCLPVSFRGSAVRAVTLARRSGRFTDRQRELLAATAPHVRAAVGRIRYADGPALQIAPQLAWVPVSSAPGLPGDSSQLRTAAGPARISEREKQVLALVAEGLTDAQIGRRLGISPATVSKHLRRIYARHGVANRVAATRLLAGPS